MRPFADRHEAGRILSGLLAGMANQPDTIVLALPRGGVPVAAEIASDLNLPLDVFAVRKIGAPQNEELAIGAIASGGIVRLDPEMVAMSGATAEQLDATIGREKSELERREREYRDDRPEPVLAGKTVVLVDDGMATGSTMLAAVQAVRERQPARVIVAVPVASREAVTRLRQEHVECRAVVTPELLFAVGAWFQDFAPTTDEEVRRLLGPFADGRAAGSLAR